VGTFCQRPALRGSPRAALGRVGARLRKRGRGENVSPD
jgi:hypothetical protein